MKFRRLNELTPLNFIVIDRIISEILLMTISAIVMFKMKIRVTLEMNLMMSLTSHSQQ